MAAEHTCVMRDSLSEAAAGGIAYLGRPMRRLTAICAVALLLAACAVRPYEPPPGTFPVELGVAPSPLATEFEPPPSPRPSEKADDDEETPEPAPARTDATERAVGLIDVSEQPEADEPGPGDDRPRRRPRSQPEPAEGPNDDADAGAGGQPTGDPSGEPRPRATTAPAPSETATEPAPEYVVVADAADAEQDAGAEVPGYADLTRLVLESTSDQLRVTVAVAADIPQQLADGEVAGIGVDLYHGEDAESGYQLFADGGSDGWRAYLQTPDGFVSFPGSFRMGGNLLVFDVPWASVGGRQGARAGSFADWAQDGEVLMASDTDYAPDEGTVEVAP